jgi:hypothetical protein
MFLFRNGRNSSVRAIISFKIQTITCTSHPHKMFPYYYVFYQINLVGYVTKVKNNISRALVALSFTPSYSGGRDQENLGLKPARANSL